MIKVNLLPGSKNIKGRTKSAKVLVVAAAMLIVSLAACAGAHFYYAGIVTDLKVEKSTLQTEADALKKQIGELNKFKDKLKRLRSKVDSIKSLETNRKTPTPLMDELSQIIPDKVWVEVFEIKGDNIILSGGSLNEESVAEFMRRLEQSPFFKAPELDVIEQGNASSSKFKLSVKVEK